MGGEGPKERELRYPNLPVDDTVLVKVDEGRRELCGVKPDVFFAESVVSQHMDCTCDRKIVAGIHQQVATPGIKSNTHSGGLLRA